MTFFKIDLWPLGTMSGSLVLLHPGTVLISMALVTTEVHADVLGLDGTTLMSVFQDVYEGHTRIHGSATAGHQVDVYGLCNHKRPCRCPMSMLSPEAGLKSVSWTAIGVHGVIYGPYCHRRSRCGLWHLLMPEAVVNVRQQM